MTTRTLFLPEESLLLGAEPSALDKGQCLFEDDDFFLEEGRTSLDRVSASFRRKLGWLSGAVKNGKISDLHRRRDKFADSQSNQSHRSFSEDGQATSFVPQCGRHYRSFSDSRSRSPFLKGDHLCEIDNVHVPFLLRHGTSMTKVSSRRQTNAVFRLDPDFGRILWESRKLRIVPLENIKELRPGSDARYYRELFNLNKSCENRWLTIIYVVNGAYKSLHLIAESQDIFQMWMEALYHLCDIRQKVMSGLADLGVRDAIWDKHYWKTASEGGTEMLTFKRAEELCRRLSVKLNSDELRRLFARADVHHKNHLCFEDFQQFVKILKSRPEIDRLYKKMRTKHSGFFNFATFESFMRNTQQSRLSQVELQAIFDHYSVEMAPTMREMNQDSFRSFLLSPDNFVCIDNHDAGNHDMTHPLSDYFISSSHNTYLVGNQLVGDSTIEGYIRALLYGCRSVEVDIYADPASSPGPMITHGKTLTSKLPLRAVCTTIAQYGFLTSLYPIIISAEMHCTYAGQEEVVGILHEVFGDMLVRKEENVQDSFEKLPSPEKLKGKILFKTKNLDLCQLPTSSDERTTQIVTSPASASDSDWVAITENLKRRASSKLIDREAVKELRDELLKAPATMLRRVRSVGKSRQRSDGHLGDTPSRSINSSPKSNYLSPSPMTLPSARKAVIQRVRSFVKSSTSPQEAQASQSASSHYSCSPNAGFLSPTSPLTSATAPVKEKTSKFRKSPTSSPPDIQFNEFPSSPECSSPKASFLGSPPPSVTSPTLASPPTVGSPAKDVTKTKSKMSPALLEILVYTVGVKFRGINKKEKYEPQHMFSLSEKKANSLLKSPSGILRGRISDEGTTDICFPNGGVYSHESGMYNMVKHCRNHLVRVYPKGTRVDSTNYDPFRFWGAGIQLVALNWQTNDLSNMINYAMFERNCRAGYVLKPLALRSSCPNSKQLLLQRRRYYLDLTIISAQQLPRLKDSSGREILEKNSCDPFVEVSLHHPDWYLDCKRASSPHSSPRSFNPRVIPFRTNVVKSNGFNPVWEEKLRIPFQTLGDMIDLVFVRFVVRQGDKGEHEDPLGVYCASLANLGRGYRHLPLHDLFLSQYLFSTLFVKINIRTDE